ncbi:MAG: mechanosensitive ion channel, partial [Nodosilinea sp.]
LELPGLLAPVEDLINSFLQAIPRIVTAGIILAIGWVIARIVRGVVTNLLAAAGADRLGHHIGLPSTSTSTTSTQAGYSTPGTADTGYSATGATGTGYSSTGTIDTGYPPTTGTTGTGYTVTDTSSPSSASADSEGLSLSGLVGTVAYVLVLIPAVVAALNELDIEAISGPAVSMLERVLDAVPQIIMAGLVVAAAYFVGRFVADLVTSLLRGAGFDSIMSVLGLPELSLGTGATAQPGLDAEGRPIASVQTPSRTPSELVGVLTLVAIVLFGAVTATEILNFPGLTEIVRAVLRIGARVLSGVVVFAVGLYLANLAFRLVNTMGTGQARVLAQAARIAILVFVGAMALQQMGVAPDIVNLAFGLLLGAIAVAIAIAFGLGGREVAATELRDWLASFKQRQ